CLTAALGQWPSEDSLHLLVIGNKMEKMILDGIALAGNGRVTKLPLYQKGDPSQEKMMAASCATVWEQLLSPVAKPFRLELAGDAYEWVYPNSFADVQSGDELIWFTAIRPSADAEKTNATITLRQQCSGVCEDQTFDFSDVRSEIFPQFAPLLKRQ